MNLMKEALNRRMGKGLQITIVAQPGAEVELGAGDEHEEKEHEGSDLAPPNKDEKELGRAGEADGTDGDPSLTDPLDNAPAINRPRGSLFQRAEMAQAMKQKKGK